MQPEQILRADLLDIIFDGRNKAYGAYDLRKTYHRRIKYAMAAMMALCLFFLIGMILANTKKGNTIAPPPAIEVNLIDPPSKVKKQVIVPPPKPKIAEIKTIKFTAPKITQNMQKDILPPQDALNDIKIASVTKNGKDFGDIVIPPVENSTITGIGLKTAEPEFTSRPIYVQIEAKFPGGLHAWERFLQTNLNTSLPVDNGAPPGSYTVVVAFLVDREGNVSEVQALNDPGYGTPDEAVRVIKKSRQWIPAIQNGRNVVYRQKQKITFIVYEN